MIKLLITGFAVLAMLFVALGVERWRMRDVIAGAWLAFIGAALVMLVLALTAHFGRVQAALI